MQEDDADEGEWNVSKAAAVCLGLMAQTIEDDIVHQLIPFITQVSIRVFGNLTLLICLPFYRTSGKRTGDSKRRR